MGLFSNFTIERRLNTIERKLDAVLIALGIDPHTIARPNGPVDPAVLRLVQNGDKIGAIKLYRDQTGVGLAEAKAYVESIG